MHLPTTAAVGEGEGEREGVWPSEGVDLVKLVEREVEEVRLEWEESQEAVCRHQTTITKLTVRLVRCPTLYRAHQVELCHCV